MAKIDKVLVWERADGGISVTHLDDRDIRPGETQDDFIQRYSDRLKLDDLFAAATLTVIDSINVPTAEENRQHWSLIKGAIQVDPDKVQAASDLLIQKQTAQNAVLQKLGLSKEEQQIFLNADSLKG